LAAELKTLHEGAAILAFGTIAHQAVLKAYGLKQLGADLVLVITPNMHTICSGPRGFLSRQSLYVQNQAFDESYVYGGFSGD